MVALTPYTPGLAGSDSETFTQTNALLAGRAPTMTSYGKAIDDLPAYSLVGRVTATNLLVLSNAGASDGSQVPVGVTTHAVTNDDSNSAVDSNSALATGNGADVAFYLDGVFNFDVINKGTGWTLAGLRQVLETSGANFSVDVIKTATPTEPAS